MWPFRRRDPEPPPEPVKGVGVWTAADLFGLSEPKAEHVVTPTGQHGVYLHSFKAATPTEAERERAEWAALAESNRALSPGMRQPTARPRQSPFSTTPNPDSFPGA